MPTSSCLRSTRTTSWRESPPALRNHTRENPKPALQRKARLAAIKVVIKRTQTNAPSPSRAPARATRPRSRSAARPPPARAPKKNTSADKFAPHCEDARRSRHPKLLTGSMMRNTVWWSTKASGEIERAILISPFRKTCCSESNARPASSLREPGHQVLRQ